MKYINEWLTAQDLLQLMQGKTDREAVLTVVICYIDATTEKTFQYQHKGKVLHKSAGEGPMGWTTISLRDDGQTIAERVKNGFSSSLDDDPIWRDFANWLKENKKT